MKKNNSIYIVIVLFEKELDNCLPLQFLLQNKQILSSDYELLVYNNSPETTILPDKNYDVFNARQNNMLAGAYNYALEQAIKTQKKWLLLLDQDTELTIDYFEELKKNFKTDIPEKIGAIIPQVKKHTHCITPKTYFPKFGPYFFSTAIKKPGIYNKCFLSINSGTILNIEIINEIGGFSSKYPLDGLDFWYFYQLYKKKVKVYVMNVVIEQNLSILDYSGMNIQRYNSILNAELQFCTELGLMAVFFWKLRILLRAVKNLYNNKKRNYTFLTLSYLFK